MKLRPVHVGLALFLCLGVLWAVWALNGTPPVQPAHTGAPTTLPAAGILDSRCTDPVGDATGADITDVALVGTADELVAGFAFTGPIPRDGVLILSIDGRSPDGSRTRQLKIVLSNAAPVGAFVVTSPDAAPVRLVDAVHIEGNEVHAGFPADALTPLGSQWKWTATAGDQNSIDDSCVESAASVVG